VTPDLEAILAAEEEARAHVEQAQRDARAALEGLRSQLERAREDRRRASEELEQVEIRGILAESERLAQQRIARRREWRERRLREAEPRLAAAAERIRQILQEGPDSP
jgi:hypothetical protein